MLVMLSVCVIAVRPVQKENAPSPILVTLFGRVMEIRLLQLMNAQ